MRKLTEIPTPLDLTPYMWTLRAMGERYFRLELYVVPGWAGELATRLRDRGVKCKPRGRSCVRVTASADVLLALELLDAPPAVLAEARAYRELVRRRYGGRTEAEREEIRRQAARVLAMIPPRGSAVDPSRNRARPLGLQ